MNHANHMSISAPVQNTSPIDEALARLESQASQLSDIVSRMARRLDPVLVPTGPTASGAGPDSARPMGAPLVEKIDGLTEFLRSSCANLDEIDHRLAL